jgi:hypothetical protein
MGPMLRWYVFTIAMRLLPFSFSVLLQCLRGVPPSEWQSSPELLFFSVMVSASQLGGIFATLSSGRGRWGAWPTFLSMMFGLFLISAIISAALYGVYVDQERNLAALAPGLGCAELLGGEVAEGITASLAGTCREWLDFQTNLFRFSIWMAGAVGVLGTFTEWVRTRRQR